MKDPKYTYIFNADYIMWLQTRLKSINQALNAWTYLTSAWLVRELQQDTQRRRVYHTFAFKVLNFDPKARPTTVPPLHEVKYHPTMKWNMALSQSRHGDTIGISMHQITHKYKKQCVNQIPTTCNNNIVKMSICKMLNLLIDLPCRLNIPWTVRLINIKLQFLN
jgi:hypothetical protein